MEKRKFNVMDVLGEQLAGVADLNTSGPEQIEYIDIGLLDGDERNFYQLTDIDELADNIQMCGLQQPIRVRAGEGGRFTIVSGHRRRAALAQLVEKGLGQFRRVPCIRETDDASPALQELRLIFANSSTRKLTSAEIGEQAERVEALLYQLKEDGFEFPEGRMRDVVAAACNTHGSKLARIKVIRERLLSNLRPAWDGGRMPEQAAYALAQFPADMQMRISKAFPKLPNGPHLERLLRLYKEDGYRWEPCLTCPDGKECKHGDAFLRHDADSFVYEVCGGKKCCLDCPHATAECYSCDKACAKAKAKRKEKLDAKKADAEKATEKHQRKLERAIQASAARLARAADAAELPDTATAIWSRYGGGYTVGKLRKFASGDFQGKHVWVNELEPENIYNIDKTAKALHCSADYIVGLTDELTPPTLPEGQLMIAGWMPGSTNPAEPGEFAAYVDLGDGKLLKRFFDWDGQHWMMPGGIEAQVPVVWWMRLPPVPAAGKGAEK
nr:MAG TPA: chromosome partitioning protein [Caudoviricetes sp.]